jgi:hypothetical protein
LWNLDWKRNECKRGIVLGRWKPVRGRRAKRDEGVNIIKVHYIHV